MALIVENGTGLPDAESYVSVADCTAYAVKFGVTFAGDVPAQEAALRNATRYLDAEFKYRGERRSCEQALEWPRCIGHDGPPGVPREVIAACCELACKGVPLWQDVDPEGIHQETVGPITTVYNDPINGGQTYFAGVAAMLRRWTVGGASFMKVVRC